MTAPTFTLPTEAEERGELEQLVGSLQQPTDDTILDAVASDALRLMAQEDAEIARYRKALEAEMQRIYARYNSLLEPHEKLRAQAEGIVVECATRAQFVGKAKSRKVGNGAYGRRQVPEKVTVTDSAALLPWLKTNYPGVIKVETVEKVVAAELKPVVIAHMKGHEGELAPGVEYTEAHDKPFATPLPLEGL